MKKVNKKVYIEIMRIIAIFFVLFNHTGTQGFFMFAQRPVGSLQFWIYLFISILCKISVPLFFMISGALLLHKNEDLKTLWSKRILKIVIVLIGMSVVYYVYEVLVTDTLFNLKTLLKTIYSSTTRVHLWYLYAFIAFLISLPFLRALAQKLETKYFCYMLFLSLALSAVLPVLEYFAFDGAYTLNSNVVLKWISQSIVLYPCVGYFLEHRVDVEKSKKYILPLCIVSIITICLSCYLTYHKGVEQGMFSEATSQSFHSTFVIVPCIAIYLGIKSVFINIKLPARLEKVILLIGENVFGIYLLHILLINQPFIKVIYTGLTTLGCNAMLATFIQCFCLMIVTCVVVLIIKKIPILKKIIGE